MGLIILFSVLLVLGFLFLYLGNKFYSLPYDVFGIIGLVVGGMGLVICLCIEMTLKSDWEYFESKYYNLKQQIEYVDKDEIITSENLRNQVLEMNNKIDSHRIYHKNIWVGSFYSEKIGNLPKLEWKSK